MVTKKYHVFIFALLLLIAQLTPAAAQIIHQDELKDFIGWFAFTRVNRDKIIDCSQFEGWMLDGGREDSATQAVLGDINFMRAGHHAVTSGRSPRCKAEEFTWMGRWNERYVNLRKYRWHILGDSWGHELQQNVLTVWKVVAKDSLKFVCAQTGPFDTGIGSAAVRRVTAFPDSSLLLVLQTWGEGQNGFRFMRGTELCNFELFHAVTFKSWADDSGRDFKRITYDFEKLITDYYRLVETTEYYTVTLDYEYSEYGREHLDSASVQIIDLWELAREYFDLPERK